MEDKEMFKQVFIGMVAAICSFMIMVIACIIMHIVFQ